MNGGPSQMDLFDYKPKMAELFDKDLPESIRKGQRLTTMTSGQARFPIAPSKYKFAAARPVRRLGQRAAAVHGEDRRRPAPSSRPSAPRRSTTTRPSPTSAPATSSPAGRASGSWLSYGLGTMNAEPAGVRRDDRRRGPAARRRPGALQPPLGLAASCPASTRASPCARRATRCCSCRTRPASTPPTRRRMLDAPRPAQPAAVRRGRRPRDAGPHRPVRDGLPHADVACPS